MLASDQFNQSFGPESYHIEQIEALGSDAQRQVMEAASAEASNGETSHIQHVEEYKYRSPNKQFSATSSGLASGLATPTLNASVHQFNKGGQKGGA